MRTHSRIPSLPPLVFGLSVSVCSVFQEATNEEAVLVFDECEALFGTRSARSSKYENNTVGLLLYHLQAHKGECQHIPGTQCVG